VGKFAAFIERPKPKVLELQVSVPFTIWALPHGPHRPGAVPFPYPRYRLALPRSTRGRAPDIVG